MTLVVGAVGGLVEVGPRVLSVRGAPTVPGLLGQQAVDISTSPPIFYVFNGSSWVTDPTNLSSPTAIGNVTPNSGAFTTLSATGNVSLLGAGTWLGIEGGAVTDFIGQATLVSGTVTVANTNVSAADKIFVTREGVGASTALGVLNCSISAGASFTITALQPGTPGSTQTGDVSVVNYVIVRQL